MNPNIISESLSTPVPRTRRQVLKGLGAGAAGLAAMRMLGGTARAATTAIDDVDVLQFALNLEYLEAEYYLYATTGQGLPPQDITGTGTQGTTTIKPNPIVPFQTSLYEQYAIELARDERDHVEYLRATLTSLGVTPVARPPLDLLNSFNTLAQAAGIGPSFDPFANEVNFLLGGFIFEDVGVTAYRGGARIIVNHDLLFAAAGVLGTEGYHAGNIRGTLLSLNDQTVIDTAAKISDLRDSLDGPGGDDAGLVHNGVANVTLTDPQGLVYARTPRQVLNILYGAPGVHSGLFFPSGLNGNIS
ncbi:MAG: ferritin-like domain-containing protein [Chthoniobacterales bacterium]|nr:ferritin-like domain-containing protein [Chthoniobacterales bacterium]